MDSEVVTLSDEELLAAWTDLETRRRRLVAEEHALIAEVESRRLAQQRAMKTTAVLAARLLRITPAEARARVAAAGDLGPRRGLTGEPLAPIFARIAAAQAQGAVSAAHAKVIIDTIEALPAQVQREHAEQVEADLVEQARRFDPRTLATLARRVVALLDPDGALRDVQYRHRSRQLSITRRADGSAFGTFDLDAECAEHLLTALTALAKPRPAVDGTPDPRSSRQRHHDALGELAKLAMRAELLPTVNGVTATVLLVGTVDAFTTGHGLVATGTGALIPAVEARRWASGDSRFFATLIDKAKRRPTEYTVGARLFTETQRLAMTMRDRGCSFPGCTTPPALCQAHHITDWANGGPTSIANGALLCGHHHREFATLGWTCTMIEGIPHWTAPHWLDPGQTPQRNTAHDPIAVT